MTALDAEIRIPSARAITQESAHEGMAFTIATLVTDKPAYRSMRASFAAAGFTGADCEYIYIDNTTAPQVCAYAGLNRALSTARGRHVILCHQDVRMIPGGDDRAALEARLDELSERDADWALVGNAGGVAPGRLAVRISDPHGAGRHVGDLPAVVTTLDENFIVVRYAANLGLSRDLTGFHFYGSDLCLSAATLGWRAYVIDFHIEHLSPGHRSPDFEAGREAFRAKWSNAFRPRWLQTTCALLRIDGEPLRRLLGRLAEAPLQKISRRLPHAAGWTRRRDEAA